MDEYRTLAEKLKGLSPKSGSIYQGIVTALDGCTCTVRIGDIEIPDIRLRASESAKDGTQMLVCPKIGTACILGSLSGDLADLCVLTVDEVEGVIIHGKVEINDGNNGGLVNIEDLVKKLNTMENDINNLKTLLTQWIPVPQDGGASLKASVATWAGQQIRPTTKADIEDINITH